MSQLSQNAFLVFIMSRLRVADFLYAVDNGLDMLGRLVAVTVIQ